MEQSIEGSLEIMNLTGQHQPLSMPDASSTDEFDKILAEFTIDPSNTPGETLESFDSNDSDDLFNIDALINSSNETGDLTFIESQLSHTSIDSDEILQLLESIKQEDSLETEQPQQSTFIESYYPTNPYESQLLYPSSVSLPVGSSPVETKANQISDLIYAQHYIDEQQQILKAASKSKRHKSHQQRSTTVAPVDYIIHSGGCQPYANTQMQYDFAHQQQLLEYDAAESKKIQIKCQPRSKYRPRTENESKTSSHYLRCEDDIKPEYPTIAIPRAWMFQSDVNLIEVALMGIDKEAHPYCISNKNSSDTFEDNTLIFKQNDPNVLYFRLTNEDFQNGFKTFMIELIKSKQDDVITKELIRKRQLEHSMLRFTRIFQVGKGNFQRDEGSEEYSSVMSEAYGDVDIEHMGPRYGPMSGQEMVYIVLKGRILKNDIKIDIVEPMIGWSYSVENFTKNGNVVYFLMPAYPHPQFTTAKANIIIYYKGEEIHESPYLYKGSLDQELAELRLNDPCTTTASSSTSNTFNPLDFFSATGACPNSSSRRTSTPKRTKRLNKK